MIFAFCYDAFKPLSVRFPSTSRSTISSASKGINPTCCTSYIGVSFNFTASLHSSTISKNRLLRTGKIPSSAQQVIFFSKPSGMASLASK